MKKKMQKASRTIELNAMTKVEGHAKLLLNIDRNNRIRKCELESIEGSRYFEGMLKGRQYFEAPEITSRICGICSCAHVAASIKAVEAALGMEASQQTKQLRELFTVGERIRSHVTHMYFLSLPDYFGVESGLELARKNKPEVMRALRLIKLGNDMITLFAGRDLHPVSAQIGGFLHLPSQDELDDVRKKLKEALPDAVAAAKLFSKLHYPRFRKETEYCTLIREGTYPLMEGDLFSSKGSRFPEDRYGDFFKEYHEKRSTANFVVKDGKSYMVGALSRLNNNCGNLAPEAKKIVKLSKIRFPSHNPFLIPFAQSVEVVHFIETAIKLLGNFKVREEEPARPRLKAGRGTGIIEVPRGLLIHEYELDGKGFITRANIITPTVQNLRLMEESIREYLPSVLSLDNKALTLAIEKLIRSFDPCFSCSTHFLDITFEGARKNA